MGGREQRSRERVQQLIKSEKSRFFILKKNLKYIRTVLQTNVTEQSGRANKQHVHRVRLAMTRVTLNDSTEP